jgi:hypothetical protein
MKIYKLLASPLKTTLEKQEFPQSTALPSTTINMAITTDFSTLGNRFIARGDYVKNTVWGSRLTTTKGREVHKVMQNNLKRLSTRQPTYWPSDPNNIPDLVDFCVTKGFDTKKFTVESCLDLTSDHTPILTSMFTHIPRKLKKPSLYSKKTYWNFFWGNSRCTHNIGDTPKD